MKLIIAVLLSAMSLWAIHLLSPMVDDQVSLAYFYDFKAVGIVRDQNQSAFRAVEQGKYLVKAGGEKKISGRLVFKEPIILVMQFETYDEPGDQCANQSDSSSIAFGLKLNGDRLYEFNVKESTPYLLTKKFEPGDELTIYPYYVNDNTCQWGLITLTKDFTEALIAQFLISLIWAFFIFYLCRSHHIMAAVNSILIFFAYLLAEKLNFGPLRLAAVLTYMLLAIGLSLFLLVISQNTKNLISQILSVLAYIGLLFLYLLPISFIIYILKADTTVTPDSLYAIFQSNPAEALDYLVEYIGLLWVGCTLFGLILIFLLVYSSRGQLRRLDLTFALVLISIFSVTAYANSSDLKLISLVSDSFGRYVFELDKFREVQQKREDSTTGLRAEKISQGETYIVVIGESQNKQHMGLYGYLRDTTPKMSALRDSGQIIVYENAYAVQTHTVPVLKLSLTAANQINQISYYEAPSIIDVSMSAGFTTSWLTNQVTLGDWDNLVSVIADGADDFYKLNKTIGMQFKTGSLDEDLLPLLQRLLNEKIEKNRLIIIHLMGNHWNYCDRFPKNFKFFKGSLQTGHFGNKAKIRKLAKRVNCYDNSILYTDHILDKIVQSIKLSAGVSGMIYFSDHADDVLNQKGHDAGRFTFPMTNIPFFMWFSEGYQSKYSAKYQQLFENRDKWLPNDLIFDALLGILGIDTNSYVPRLDVSNESFSVSEHELYLFERSRKFAVNENFSFIQRKNIRKLKKLAQLSRVIPHRVNSIGKARQTIYDGYRSIEIDLVFRNLDGGFFEVGHDDKFMSGASLKQFIEEIPISDMDKIWLDLKNLSQDNMASILDRLKDLDDTFNIKSKLILESSITDSSFSKISTAGFHTSYYLPTEELVDLIKKNDESAIVARSAEISAQIVDQRVSAISFDAGLYPFVQKYLEPLLPVEIVYHTWDLSLPMIKGSVVDDLLMKNYYQDSRVKTILLPYHSDFNL